MGGLLRLLLREVVGFPDVLAEVVEFSGGLCGVGKVILHQLPIAGLDCTADALFMEFPVEVSVFFLITVAGECRFEGNTLDAVRDSLAG